MYRKGKQGVGEPGVCSLSVKGKAGHNAVSAAASGLGKNKKRCTSFLVQRR